MRSGTIVLIFEGNLPERMRLTRWPCRRVVLCAQLVWDVAKFIYRSFLIDEVITN